MLAVDTNVVVRYLTGDHAQQYARARALIESGPIYLATTVLLETEWVLRTVYKFAPLPLARALRGLAGLPTVTVQEPVHLRSALDWLEVGIELADAFHLAAAQACDAFVTFDGALIKKAKGVCDVPVRAP